MNSGDGLKVENLLFETRPSGLWPLFAKLYQFKWFTMFQLLLAQLCSLHTHTYRYIRFGAQNTDLSIVRAENDFTWFCLVWRQSSRNQQTPRRMAIASVNRYFSYVVSTVSTVQRFSTTETETEWGKLAKLAGLGWTTLLWNNFLFLSLIM